MYIKRAPGAVDIDELPKTRYLIHGEYTIGHVVCLIRSKIKIKSHKALFVFIDGNILPPVSATVSDLYTQHKNPKDAMLHLYYRPENTFG